MTSAEPGLIQLPEPAVARAAKLESTPSSLATILGQAASLVPRGRLRKQDGVHVQFADKESTAIQLEPLAQATALIARQEGTMTKAALKLPKTTHLPTVRSAHLERPTPTPAAHPPPVVLPAPQESMHPHLNQPRVPLAPTVSSRILPVNPIAILAKLESTLTTPRLAANRVLPERYPRPGNMA